jgi:cytochrome c-type biogenesis protein CcmF
MEVGSYAELAGYSFTFRGTTEHDGPNYRAARGTIEISKNGKLLAPCIRRSASTTRPAWR